LSPKFPGNAGVSPNAACFLSFAPKAPWLPIDLIISLGVGVAPFQAKAQASLRTPKAALRAARKKYAALGGTPELPGKTIRPNKWRRIVIRKRMNA